MSSKLPPEDFQVDSTKKMRRAGFLRLVKSWKFWLPTGALALAAFLFGLTQGGGMEVGLPLMAVFVVLAASWSWSKESAEDSFHAAYARSRGLKSKYVRIPEKATPLLRAGIAQGTKWTLTGEVAPGIDGVLALYYHSNLDVGVDTTGTKGVYFTLGLVRLPECAALVPELYCRPKYGPGSLEKIEDAFGDGLKRVALESDALDARYEIFVRDGQDETWLRRLFSPSFIVWLAESPPDEFIFELVHGVLVAFIPGRHEDVAALDAVWAATGTVARRLHDEATETSRPDAAPEPSKA
jgi:hypothetical protein